MTNLEHKIPPPLVAVMCGLVIWWLAGTTPGVVDPYGVAQPLAVLVAIMGLVFDSGGVFWLNTPDTSRRDKLFTNRGANHEPETYLQTVPARI